MFGLIGTIIVGFIVGAFAVLWAYLKFKASA
jgi:hypothetical protein